MADSIDLSSDFKKMSKETQKFAKSQVVSAKSTKQATEELSKERIELLKAAQAKKTNFRINKDLEIQRKKELKQLRESILARNKVATGFFSLSNGGRLAIYTEYINSRRR